MLTHLIYLWHFKYNKVLEDLCLAVTKTLQVLSGGLVLEGKELESSISYLFMKKKTRGTSLLPWSRNE